MKTIATVTHVEGTKLDAASASGHTVRLDGGSGKTGPTPMEALLLALGGCSTVTIAQFLTKMRQPYTLLEVELSGDREEEPPRIYTKIHAHYRVAGDVDHKRVQRAIEMTHSKYCSVHTMLEQSAEMSHTIEYI